MSDHESSPVQSAYSSIPAVAALQRAIDVRNQVDVSVIIERKQTAVAERERVRDKAGNNIGTAALGATTVRTAQAQTGIIM